MADRVDPLGSTAKCSRIRRRGGRVQAAGGGSPGPPAEAMAAPRLLHLGQTAADVSDGSVPENQNRDATAGPSVPSGPGR
ncbi:unnamed protein product [Merluccius merluccius]